MSTPPLPAPVAALAQQLAALPGVLAVTLGGSRATGAAREDSDWDLGIHHRPSQRALRPDDLRALGYPGYVSEHGEWGPIVDGGAWLTVGGVAVDVLYRDLDRVEVWLEDARAGRFEIVPQNGYLAGAPTYVPVGELAIARHLAGAELPRPSRYPPALAAGASGRWTDRARLSLMFAGLHARGGDAVPCAGMLAHALLCAAHARLAERGEWVLNEKRLVTRAGLEAAGAALAVVGATARELEASAAAVADALGLEPVQPR